MSFIKMKHLRIPTGMSYNHLKLNCTYKINTQNINVKHSRQILDEFFKQITLVLKRNGIP